MKIAAVFASYNRSQTALSCLERLRNQTRPLDLVVIGENGSEDGSVEAYSALGWEKLMVLPTGGNLGNAGAVQLAMDEAFACGMDAVWILDDDSWPRLNALEEMLRDGFDENIVLHPLQIEPRTGRFTWPLQVLDAGGRFVLVSDCEALASMPRIQTRGVWTGALISRKVREVVGPVNGALFIRGEDEEYPWRIEKAGFTWNVAPAAMMDHPGPERLEQWSFLGFRLFLEPGLVGWKLYYKVRNMVWLKQRKSGMPAAAAIALAYVLAVASVDGLSREKCVLLKRAIVDGFKGRLGPM